MQSLLRSQVSGWVGFAAAGAFVSVLMLTGCPGTLDPTLFNNTSGAGGNTGTGGGNPTGGSTGTGGVAANCTGGNDGVSILTSYCAVTGGCHVPGASNEGVSGGLDLTPDSNIASRLVGVTSVGTANNMSQCTGQTAPYLKSGSNPATGLMIDKFTMTNPPCGAQMPASAPFPLTAIQQTCLTQWATTLTSP
jgi:hypothetical protein